MNKEKSFAVIPIIIILVIAGGAGGYYFNSQRSALLVSLPSPVDPVIEQEPAGETTHEKTSILIQEPNDKTGTTTPPEKIGPYGDQTLYNGIVEIAPVSLADIQAKLKARKIYFEAEEGEQRIVVYPYGPGMGPNSFTLSRNSLIAVKDIPGSPDIEKYKAEVREDIRTIGGIITIKESTWRITTTASPGVVY